MEDRSRQLVQALSSHVSLPVPKQWHEFRFRKVSNGSGRSGASVMSYGSPPFAKFGGQAVRYTDCVWCHGADRPVQCPGSQNRHLKVRQLDEATVFVLAARQRDGNDLMEPPGPMRLASSWYRSLKPHRFISSRMLLGDGADKMTKKFRLHIHP